MANGTPKRFKNSHRPYAVKGAPGGMMHNSPKLLIHYAAELTCLPSFCEDRKDLLCKIIWHCLRLAILEPVPQGFTHLYSDHAAAPACLSKTWG